jgi:ankyrin repeat protein
MKLLLDLLSKTVPVSTLGDSEGRYHPNALLIAACNGNEAIVRFLAENGANVNALSAPNGSCGTALQLAAGIMDTKLLLDFLSNTMPILTLNGVFW